MNIVDDNRETFCGRPPLPAHYSVSSPLYLSPWHNLSINKKNQYSESRLFYYNSAPCEKNSVVNL